jgi:hypothetical protein
MNTKLAVAMVSAVLAACGSKSDASARNFGAALDAYLQSRGRLCLHTDRWPVEVDKREVELAAQAPDWRSVHQMLALQAAGLVDAKEIEVAEKPSFGRVTGQARGVVQYTLTEAAKPFMHEPERKHSTWERDKPVQLVDLCWARKELDKVVKWEGPMKYGDFQTARVIYTYKIVDKAAWADRPEIRKAFRQIEAEVERSGREDDLGLKLTSEGWEAQTRNLHGLH